VTCFPARSPCGTSGGTRRAAWRSLQQAPVPASSPLRNSPSKLTTHAGRFCVTGDPRRFALGLPPLAVGSPRVEKVWPSLAGELSLGSSRRAETCKRLCRNLLQLSWKRC